MDSGWERGGRREPSIFQEGDSAARGDPNPIAKVLKDDRIIRQAISLVLDGNAAVIPPVQPSRAPSHTLPSRPARTDSAVAFDKPCVTEILGTAGSRKRRGHPARRPKGPLHDPQRAVQ